MNKKILAKASFIALILVYFLLNYYNTWFELKNIYPEQEMILKIILFILFILNFLVNFKDLNKNKIIYLLGGLLFFILTGDYRLLLIILFAIFSLDLKKRELAKCFYYISLSLFTLTLLLYYIDFFTFQKTLYRIVKFDSTLIKLKRLTLGFNHPNRVHVYFFGILLPFLIYKYRYLSKFKMVILLMISLFLSIKTASRVGILIVLLLVVLSWIINKVRSKYFKNISNFLLIGIFITYILSIFGSTKLDIILSRRLSYWRFYFDRITFFGRFNNLEKYYLAEKFILDNTYIYILYVYGILGFSILAFLLYLGVKNMYKKKDYLLVMILLIIFSFSETTLMGNGCMIYFFVEIFRNGLYYSSKN